MTRLERFASDDLLVVSQCLLTEDCVCAVKLPFEGGEFVGWTPVDEAIDALFD